MDKFLFSAPISPGSSGGGLFNQEGKVIGITAASENITAGPQTGQAQNLNLAVPINRLKSDLHPGGTEELQNSNPGYYYSLGNLADNKKEWDQAIPLYTEALSVDRDYSDAYVGLAGDYYEKGDYELEVSNYEEAVKTDPTNAIKWDYLGTAYEDVGEFDKAIDAYSKALMIEPEFKDALHDLSIVYLAVGDVEKARQLLPRLTAVNKGWGKKIALLISRISR